MGNNYTVINPVFSIVFHPKPLGFQNDTPLKDGCYFRMPAVGHQDKPTVKTKAEKEKEAARYMRKYIGFGRNLTGFLI